MSFFLIKRKISSRGVVHSGSLVGFSLIETILSIAIGMTLMMAATFYLFGLTQAYVRLEEDPLFDDHVEGVCSLLESFIGTTRQSPVTRGVDEFTEGEAAKPMPVRTNTKRKGKGDLRWQTPPGGGEKDFVLAFTPQVASLFFSGLPGPLPSFDGYLSFVQKEGLFLIYQTPADKKDSVSRVSVFLLSTYVKALDYAFYDEKLDRWTFSAALPPGASDEKPKLPSAVRLRFEDEGHVTERYIYLPVSTD